MNIRTFAFAAIILTAACSPDAGVGPTVRKSNDETPSAATNDKRETADTAGFSCNTAYTQGKSSCVPRRWNGQTVKR